MTSEGCSTKNKLGILRFAQDDTSSHRMTSWGSSRIRADESAVCSINRHLLMPNCLLFSFISEVYFAIARKYHSHTAHFERYFLAQPLFSHCKPMESKIVKGLIGQPCGFWKCILQSGRF